jgi:hypothetical protein
MRHYRLSGAAYCSALTFLTVSPRSLGTNAASKLYWNQRVVSVPSVLTFVKVPAARRYESQNRDTSAALLPDSTGC